MVGSRQCERRLHDSPSETARSATELAMIQQQTQVDIADNTGAKEGMCIKVLRGSSSKAWQSPHALAWASLPCCKLQPIES